MITKGCVGKLVPVKETNLPIASPSVAGVEDWFARGSPAKMEALSNATPNFELSTSSTGSLVVAVKSQSTPPPSLTLTLEQKRVGDVAFQQYQFRPTSAFTLVFGKDVNGKNLRFDDAAIAEDRITVRVNGVETKDFDLQPNKITFRTQILANSIVDIIVYTEKSTSTRTLTLIRNKTLVPSLTRGAWSNIDYVLRIESSTTKWYLYSIDLISGLAAGKIRVVGNNVADDAMILLASTPYQSLDRYLNFVIDQSALSSDFNLTHTSGTLTASQDLLSELFPPLVILPEAQISTDLYTASSSSEIITDTTEVRFTSKKILGPV